MSILITGAAWGLGSEVFHFLRHWTDPTKLIATSRNAENASRFESAGTTFRVVDYTKPETMQHAFQGVEKIFLVSTRTLSNEERVKEQNEAIDAAVAAGVKHVYYTSSATGGYDNQSKVYIQKDHLATEKHVKSGKQLS